MIQAVIFDVDGTLVDSVDLHARAWKDAFQRFGRDVPFEEVRHQIGKGADQLLPVFFSNEELREFGAQLEEYRAELFKQAYLPRVTVFPKVRELFRKIVGDGKRIAQSRFPRYWKRLTFGGTNKGFKQNREPVACHRTTAWASAIGPAGRRPGRVVSPFVERHHDLFSPIATVAETSSRLRKIVLAWALPYSRPILSASRRYSELAISVSCRSKSTFSPTIDDRHRGGRTGSLPRCRSRSASAGHSASPGSGSRSGSCWSAGSSAPRGPGR